MSKSGLVELDKPALLNTQTGEAWPEVFLDVQAIQDWAAKQEVPWSDPRGRKVDGCLVFSNDFLSEVNRAILDNMYDAISRKKAAMRQGLIKPNDPAAFELS